MVGYYQGHHRMGTFFNELTTGVLNTRWARLTAASRIRTIPALLVRVALEGIGHGDEGVHDFRCPWCDLGRRDTEKTRGSRRTRIHVHIQVVHDRFRLPFNLKQEQRLRVRMCG